MYVYAHCTPIHAHITPDLQSLYVCWTLLSNFHFLHHPQILTCLEAIAKYRNMHAIDVHA